MKKYFNCAGCGKLATSVDFTMTLCQKCRPHKIIKCQCGKKYSTKKGKTKCRNCFKLENDYTIKNLRNLYNRVKVDPKPYLLDIKLLLIKEKWNLLNPVDYYRVCNIWMLILGNELSYSADAPNIQIKLMLNELKELFNYKWIPNKKTKTRLKRPTKFNI